jgi:hypothetical protein
MLVSPLFAGRDRLCRLLSFVVDQSLTNPNRKLKQFTIAVEALGYERDFNPNTDPSVRILAQRVRRALGRYYATEGAEDPIRIEVPKGTYVPVYSPNTPRRQDAASALGPTSTSRPRRRFQRKKGDRFIFQR